MLWLVTVLHRKTRRSTIRWQPRVNPRNVFAIANSDILFPVSFTSVEMKATIFCRSVAGGAAHRLAATSRLVLAARHGDYVARLHFLSAQSIYSEYRSKSPRRCATLASYSYRAQLGAGAVNVTSDIRRYVLSKPKSRQHASRILQVI